MPQRSSTISSAARSSRPTLEGPGTPTRRRPVTDRGLLVRPRSRRRSDDRLALDELAHQCVSAESPAGDHILLHVPSGTYLRLDGSAPTIVDLLTETGDRDQAAAMLAARFDLPMTRAVADVDSVVTALSGLRATRASHPRRPTVAGTAEVIRSWWRLPGARRVAVLKVTAVVVGVEAGLRVTDVGRLASRVGVPLAARTSVAPGGDSDGDVARLTTSEQRDYWAASWVLDRWLYDGTCLRRALVTGFLLRRHRPVLHLGLIDDGRTSHAWVEADGMTFNTEPVTGLFTAFGTPREGSAGTGHAGSGGDPA